MEAPRADGRPPSQPDPGTSGTLPAVIASARLDLVLLPGRWLAAVGEGAAPPDLGFTDPHDAFADAAHVVAIRLEQVRLDPASEPWLMRAVVLRETGEAIGHVGFHGPPDGRGMVEIGYTVLPAFRRRGFAREAAEAMWAAAGRAGARVLRASVGPHNEASLALVRAAGFTQVGEQEDEDDGLELVWERPAGRAWNDDAPVPGIPVGGVQAERGLPRLDSNQ